MHGHRIVRAECLLLPDLLVDLLDGEHLSLVLQKKQQDVVLNPCQTDRLAVHRHFLLVVVNDQSAGMEDILLLRGCLGDVAQRRIPPHLTLDARDKLQRVERLCDIIVRPDIQAENLVCILGLRRQHNNRNAGCLPDLQDRMNSVHLRHHQVNDQKMNLFLLHDLQRLFSVVSLQHSVAFLAEVDLDRIRDLLLIVTDKNVVHPALPSIRLSCDYRVRSPTLRVIITIFYQISPARSLKKGLRLSESCLFLPGLPGFKACHGFSQPSPERPPGSLRRSPSAPPGTYRLSRSVFRIR